MVKNCKNCEKSFEIFSEDRKFYEKVEVPEPLFCPSCRAQRRFAYRNERGLYKRKCDKCDRSIVAMFPPEEENAETQGHFSARNVYCEECWWSDSFDPLDFGKDFDFKRPFFEQMNELFLSVPMPHLIIGSGENADYTNYSWKNKDSYLLSSSDYSENCYYSDYLFRTKDSVDCLFVSDSELAYQCIDAKNCYFCAFLQNCQDLSDCYFCFDCRGCQNCLGCIGLRQKKYHIFNKEYSKEEYEKKKKEFFAKNKNMDELRKQFVDFKLKFSHKYAEIENCENCSGDHLLSSKNLFHCFDMVECEDIRYGAQGLKAKDCMDVTGVTPSELCYESGACPENYFLKFCIGIWPKSSYLEYCLMCRSSDHCFGCVSLKKNEYCIFNKQYSKEEYERMVGKIKAQMKETGEYGEMFPVGISPFAYNETVAMAYYPMKKEEVLKKKWKWRDEKIQVAQKNICKLPEDDSKIPDDICDRILACEVTGKPYKIIPAELNFYKKMKLPIPRRCPEQRYHDRMAIRNPRELFERKCEKCKASVLSSYSGDRPEKIYCEKCYLEELY